MSRLLTATAICGTLLLSINPASAAKFGCNPAIQNWQNGSKDTCPYAAGNASVTPVIVIDTYTPPVVEEEPEEEPVG